MGKPHVGQGEKEGWECQEGGEGGGGLVKYQLSQKPYNEVWERGFWFGVGRIG